MNYRRIVVVMALLLGILGSAVSAAEIPPREEMVVVAAWMPVPKGWNPVLPMATWGHLVMYPSLFMYTPLQDRWIPYLADSFRWVDRYTLEVTIRPEARWWDGVAITAHDVAFTWGLGQRHVTALYTPAWDFLAEVKAIDDRTVHFVTDQARLNYFELIGVLDAPILPRHRWEALEREHGAGLATDFRDDDPAQIVGGGPYRLAWWTEDFWLYERVEGWWGEGLFGRPAPRYIGHRRFKDNPAGNLAFSRLELDLMAYFTPAVWELWEVHGLPVRTYYPESPFYIGSSVIMLHLNFARPPLDNPVVRRAIAHAIPFDALIEKAYFGYSVRASPAMVNPASPVAAAFIDHQLVEKYGYQFDLAAARRVLDEAGIIDRDGDGVRETPDGARLGPWFIEVPYGWTDWMMMCDMVAENLRAIGMDVTARFPEHAVWEANAHTGAFDIIIRWSAGLGLDHPWNVFRVMMDQRLTGPVGETHPAGNWARYLNPEVVPLIDAIPGEADPERLMAYYRQLQAIALREVVGIPLFYGAVWYAFAETTWVGWPKAEYPDRWFSGIGIGLWPSALPSLFGLVPVGEDPKLSPWETHLKPLAFPTSEIWEALAEVVE